MKGLLVKDLCLMATQKRFFILILGVGALLTFGGQDIIFVMGYMMMVFGLFSGSTISYDDMNHGMGFLMTLPVSRKQYNRVRLGYVIRYVWKLTLIGLTVQCLSAFLTTGTVTVWNVLYGIGILFVAPLLIGWLQLMINR